MWSLTGRSSRCDGGLTETGATRPTAYSCLPRTRPRRTCDMIKRYWRIKGYKRFDTIVDVTIPVGSLTENKLQELLKCFATKEGLSYEEIVGAYLKRNAKRAHELLHVQKNGPYPEYMCGTDPSFVSVVVDENGDR